MLYLALLHIQFLGEDFSQENLVRCHSTYVHLEMRIQILLDSLSFLLILSLSICRFASLSVCLIYIHLFTYLFIFTYIYLSLCVSIYLSSYTSLYLSIIALFDKMMTYPVCPSRDSLADSSQASFLPQVSYSHMMHNTYLTIN